MGYFNYLLKFNFKKSRLKKRKIKCDLAIQQGNIFDVAFLNLTTNLVYSELLTLFILMNAVWLEFLIFLTPNCKSI